MRPRSALRTGCFLALAVALAACGKGGQPQAGHGGGGPGGGQGDRPTPVTTEQVHLRAWNDTVQALGNVKARESVTVTAKVSEIVQSVHFDSGDHVAAGQSLVTLSGKAQQAALAQAEAAAKEAEQLYQRQTELAAQQLIARSALDTQRATRDATRARVEQMKADIGDRQVRAPFAGVLGIRQVSPGSLVTPGTAIATLDDTERVYIDFPVPETLLARVAKGQRVEGTSAAYAGQRFEGTVATVDARIDGGDRAVEFLAGIGRAGAGHVLALGHAREQGLGHREVDVDALGVVEGDDRRARGH